ncbi:hypothetical protein D3C81_821240 [compost metagenome]
MAAFTARLFIGLGSFGILDDAGPGLQGVPVMPGHRLSPQTQKTTAHIRVFHAQRAVFIPRERCPPRAAAWFELGHVRSAGRIINLLVLPGDNAVLHKYFPTARTGAVHAMRRPHHFIVRPAAAVHIFPFPAFLFDFRPIS